MALRRFLVGGNWKSNGSLAFSKSFPRDVLNNLKFDPSKVEVVVAPTALHAVSVAGALTNSNVHVSTQDISLTGNGAFTGQHSAEMIKEAGINWTLTGHSERRTLFGETDSDVGLKTKRALDHGISVIACIGELLEEREGGKTRAVNER